MLAFKPLAIVLGKWSEVTKRLNMTYLGEEEGAGQGRQLPGCCLESRVLTQAVRGRHVAHS